MILNSFGQPTLLNEHCFQWSDKFTLSPVLCRKDDICTVGNLLTKGWKGTLYTSEYTHNEMNNPNFKIPFDVCFTREVLMQNQTTSVLLKNGTVNVIVIPSSTPLGDNLFYIIKDEYVTNLVSDNFTRKDLRTLLRNETVRYHINKGIDVLYINDASFGNTSNINSHPSKLLLRCLVQEIRPRFLKGHYGNDLPQVILNDCLLKEER